MLLSQRRSFRVHPFLAPCLQSSAALARCSAVLGVDQSWGGIWAYGSVCFSVHLFCVVRKGPNRKSVQSFGVPQKTRRPYDDPCSPELCLFEQSRRGLAKMDPIRTIYVWRMAATTLGTKDTVPCTGPTFIAFADLGSELSISAGGELRLSTKMSQWVQRPASRDKQNNRSQGICLLH